MSRPASITKTFIVLVVVSFTAVGLALPFVSRHPDGLARVAERLGFSGSERSVLDSLVPGYSMPGIVNDRLSGAMAGVLGAAIAFLFAYLLGRALAAARSRRLHPGPGHVPDSKRT